MSKNSHSLRLLTWNVWFGGHLFEERAKALFTELERRRPEVIALQEVTPELLSLLALEPWVSAYALSDTDGQTLGEYGVLLMARIPMQTPRFLELPSDMGRKLLVAEFAEGLYIGTVHLESMKEYARERAVQLHIIGRHLAGLGADTVLCGDMNFTPDSPSETAALDPSFIDVWPVLRGDDPGYTVNTDINTMYASVSGKIKHQRIDRVFLRSPRWRARRIELVGTEPFDHEGFVSDHFGLEVEIGREDGPSPATRG